MSSRLVTHVAPIAAALGARLALPAAAPALVHDAEAGPKPFALAVQALRLAAAAAGPVDGQLSDAYNDARGTLIQLDTRIPAAR